MILGALYLALAMHAGAQEHVLRDPFIDGGGHGPPVVALPEIATMVGSMPSDPGFSPEAIPRRVELSAFAIGELEITNGQYCEFLNDAGNDAGGGKVFAVVGRAPSLIRREGERFVPLRGAAQRPVVAVSWQGARAYCRWLSARTGQRYDLPTAAQWEAAARAGSAAAWPWGDRDEPARHRCRREEASVAVGSHPPNAWGLYDMTGNVWEWVLDCHEPDFPAYAPLRDPLQLDDDCATPEIRGGSFKLDGAFCRPGFRANYLDAAASDEIGFRVARAVRGDFRHAEPRSGSVGFRPAVPSPSARRGVRITGKIESASNDPRIHVRIGSGPRVAAMARHRAASAAVFPPHRNENAPYGIVLPLSPTRWSDAAIAPETGRFTSEPLDAGPAVIVAFDESGGIAVVDVRIGRSGLDAGVIRIPPPAGISASVEMPLTDLPLLLSLQFDEATIADADREEAARILSVLDQVDPRLFELVMQRTPYPLPFGGTANIRWLPRFATLRVIVAPTTPALPSSTASIALQRDRLTPLPVRGSAFLKRDGGAAAVDGIVLFEGTETPVAGAKVVYSDYPLRRETVTDAAGRFAFPAVVRARGAVFFVDAGTSARDGWKRTAIFRMQSVPPSLRLALPRRDL